MTLPIHEIVIAPQHRRNLLPVPCAATMHAEYLETTLSAATGSRLRSNILRLLGIGVHLALGLAMAALLFPFASHTMRLAFARGWARRMMRALGARLCVEGAGPVQPVAIAYYGVDGRPSRDAAFIDGMTLWQSIGAICRAGHINVRLAFATPLAPAGRTRKGLAREARDTVAAILAQRPAARPALRDSAAGPVHTHRPTL